jgi:hypothetical protein
LPCLSSVPDVSAAQPVTKNREQFRQQRHEFFSWQFFKVCQEYHLVCIPIFSPERQYIGKRDANGQKKENLINLVSWESEVG